MRGLVSCIVALGLTTGVASANDLLRPSLPDDPWSGAQVGVFYGHNWMTDFNNTLRLEAEGDGDVIGVYAAYNRQSGPFVAGAEVTYTAVDNMFTDGSGVKVGNLFAAKLRGGVAYGRFHAYGMIGATHGTTNLAGDDWGAVFGVGADALLTRNIVAGMQYNYYRFVNFNHTTIDADLHELTGRIGYKF